MLETFRKVTFSAEWFQQDACYFQTQKTVGLVHKEHTAQNASITPTVIIFTPMVLKCRAILAEAPRVFTRRS